MRRRVGEAYRAGQVAMIGDLDQRQAGMLLVIRAEPAIIGTAEFGPALEIQRYIARLDEGFAAPPIGSIVGDQRRLHAMLPAALLVPDFVVDDLDLGRHQFEAGLAERLGLAPEHIGPGFTQRRVHERPLTMAPSSA